MLNNLKGNYLRSGDLTRALRTLDAILQLAPGDPVERRDRGLVREALELDAGALADFEAFLDALPTRTTPRHPARLIPSNSVLRSGIDRESRLSCRYRYC
jgi:regulator of sirC expression with transglutaminase-like and TPR domain